MASSEAQGSNHGDRNPAKQLWEFPLIKALFGRRSRRFGLGMEFPPGPMAFKSRHEPVALTRHEQDLLVAAAAGVSGWNFGIPYSPSTENAHSNYAVRLTGRTFPTGAGIGTPELFYTDDDGVYLTNLRDKPPAGNQEVSSPEDFQKALEVCRQNSLTVSDHRLTVPRESSFIAEHNLWSANFPGSTLFMPVTDMGEYFIGMLAMLVQNGNVVYDNLTGRVAGDMAPFIRSGLVQDNKRAALSMLEQTALTGMAASLAIMGQNIMLMIQAMGLGGWLYTGIDSYGLMGAAAEDGVPGLGFRFQRDSRWIAPNPIGLDGYYESVCPPYNPDMRSAVAKVVERKFGKDGTYNPELPGPFRDNKLVKGSVQSHSEEMVDCLGEICQYIYDTHGKFPATVPTIFMHAVIQAQHIDTEFYDAHYGPGAYLDTQANHMADWHGLP